MPDYQEKIVFEETNRGEYKLQLIAQLAEPDIRNARYLIRVSEPKEEGDHKVDYVSTVEGLKSLGELLNALSFVVKLPMYLKPSNTQTIADLLTSENIKTIAKYLEAVRLPSDKAQQ